MNTIIGDTNIINGATGNSITDAIGRIPTVDTGSFATTSSLQTLIDVTGSFVTTSSFNEFTSSTITNSQTSSFTRRTSVPTSLTGSEGDIDGMIAFDSEAVYFANGTYYGTGPFTTSLYENTDSSPNIPITKGNYPKPKIGWTINILNGFLVATVTNVVEYTNYWLVYTDSGNASLNAGNSVTLTTNESLDNIWLKQEFISSSIIDSLNSKTGSYATTGSNTFNDNQIVTGSVTATSFVKTGGTSSEYLMADGSATKPIFAQAFYTGTTQTLQPVVINAPNVWQPTGVVLTLSSPSNGFSLGVTDKCALKNISGSTKIVNVSAQVFTNMGGNREYNSFAFAINGNVINDSGMSDFSSNDYTIFWTIEMQNNDELSLYIRMSYIPVNGFIQGCRMNVCQA